MHSKSPWGRMRPPCLCQMQGNQEHIDGLDANEGHDDAADAVDQQVVAQQNIGRLGHVLDALEGQRNQGHNDDRVEDDRREDGRLGRVQVHNVEHSQHREDAGEHGVMMAKYLATSLAMLKVVSAPRVISNCLPISTISINLVGLESRSTMLPASLAAWGPAFMGTPTSP